MHDHALHAHWARETPPPRPWTGATCDSWDTISPALSQVREVIAVDLPGHGKTREEADSGTFEGLVRSLDEWLGAENFTGVDMVGSSLGARLVLEMARRGRAGAVVALDSGGFWQGWERTFFKTTITLSVALVRALRPALSAITGNVAGGPRSWPSFLQGRGRSTGHSSRVN